MEAHLMSWGNNIQAADKVKPLLKLHWFNCKELGLDPSDTAAAKRHFQQWGISDSYQDKINTDIFLMIDDWSASSYRYEANPSINAAEKVFPGNSAHRGHLLAVDADFDSDSVPKSKVDSSESTGDRTVLYTKYGPDYVGHSARLADFWHLAMDNPQRVFSGQTVPCQLHEWREENLLAGSMKDGFGKWLEDKDPKMAAHIKRLRAMHIF
ncbi:hypothetical protein BDW74DRAFT_174914 [Aspergillus multicolor]|uniref:uncharacterized protein n=1 Tax=Aspergillus multicolor TaxID=41759 RepID=UPI003CCD6BDC